MILALNGEEVGSVDDIHHMLADTAAGSSVTLSILRGDERKELKVITGEG